MLTKNKAADDRHLLTKNESGDDRNLLTESADGCDEKPCCLDGSIPLLKHCFMPASPRLACRFQWPQINPLLMHAWARPSCNTKAQPHKANASQLIGIWNMYGDLISNLCCYRMYCTLLQYPRVVIVGNSNCISAKPQSSKAKQFNGSRIYHCMISTSPFNRKKFLMSQYLVVSLLSRSDYYRYPGRCK